MRRNAWLGCTLGWLAACATSPRPGADVAGDLPASVDGSADGLADLPESGRPTHGVVSTTLAGWTVRVNQTNGQFAIDAPDGRGDLFSGPQSLRVGVGAPEVENLFGAFRVHLEALTWFEAVPGAPALSQAADALEIRWPLQGLAGTVGWRFTASLARDLRLEVVSDAPGVSAASMALPIAPDERFMGLGGQVWGMDLRGGRFPLWTQEQGIGKTESGEVFGLQNTREAAYAPLGILHSSAEWTWIVGHDSYSEVDVGRAAPDRLELASYLDLPALALVAGATLRERLGALGGYVGRPPPPPPWVFAPWNDSVGGPERLHQVAQTLRQAGIPSSVIWSEDWAGGTETTLGFRLSYQWAWDPAQYPDLAGEVQKLHASGFAFLAYFNTFVPAEAPRYAQGAAQGYLVGDGAGGPYTLIEPGTRPAGLVDLTNPAAVAWLTDHLTTAAVDLGIDGWMADFTEWLPVDGTLWSGESPWRYHNRYPVDWQRANRDALAAAHASDRAGAQHWTFFARSGWASTQGGTPASAATLWGGDQNTDWGYDDGFPSIVPLGVHLGLAGVPFFGTDIGGYSAFIAPPTTKELFFRWASAAAFFPLMRTHHGSSECDNWAFDRDSETLDHFRRWAVVHTLLHPTFQALAAEALADGLPILRHPWLVEPAVPEVAGSSEAGVGYQFFVGDALLVAPVMEPGATGREVHLPRAGYWPLFGASPLGGTGALAASAPATELPVFVRPGTALVLLAEPVDSFYGATETGVSDLDEVAGRYRIVLYPAPDGGVAGPAGGTVAVSGAGWPASVDWTGATLDGVALEVCGPGVTGSCAGPAGAHLEGASLTLAVGAATLRVSAPDAVSWELGIAGAGWGEWALPTPLTDLDPDVPPPCLAP